MIEISFTVRCILVKSVSDPKRQNTMRRQSSVDKGLYGVFSGLSAWATRSRTGLIRGGLSLGWFSSSWREIYDLRSSCL